MVSNHFKYSMINTQLGGVKSLIIFIFQLIEKSIIVSTLVDLEQLIAKTIRLMVQQYLPFHLENFLSLTLFSITIRCLMMDFLTVQFLVEDLSFLKPMGQYCLLMWQTLVTLQCSRMLYKK